MEVMELLWNVRRIVLGVFCIILFYCSVLWLSIILYALIYYWFIPAAAHIRPIYLQFPPSECATEILDKSMCSFPFGNITLVNDGEYRLLSRGHAYAVELALDMPDSVANQKIGMFMVQMEMLSQSRSILQYSSRPAVLSYKSFIFETIYTLFYVPYLLSGSLEEKQTVIVPLFEDYLEDSYQPTHFSYIKILSKSIQIYSCHLRIHAHFRGLRYYMYYWPVLSTVIGVGMFFFIICVTVLVVLFQVIKRSQLMNLPDQINARLQEQRQARLEKQERMRRGVRQQSSEISSSRVIQDSSDVEYFDLTDAEGEDSPSENEKSGERPQSPVKGDGSQEFDDFSDEIREIKHQDDCAADEEFELLQALRQRKA